MIKLEYVGPKASISAHGIDFDNNKDDKFIYLNVACQLIVGLDHDYIEDKKYFYDTSRKNFTPSEILDVIKKYKPDYEKLVDAQVEKTRAEIKEDLLRATENRIICDEECQVLIKNIELMKNYNIQRTVNKAVYYLLVDILANIIQRDHIEYITVPFFQEYAHVLHSAQGVLKHLKLPIDTKFDVYQKDDKQIYATLHVVSITANRPPLM